MNRLALLIAVLALALPAPALGQGSPFGPLPPANPAETATPAPSDDTNLSIEDEGGRTTLYIIGGALILVFVTLGLLLTRDARRHLPREERERLALQRDAGPHRHKRQAKAKARAKGRAARAARKRTARHR